MKKVNSKLIIILETADESVVEISIGGLSYNQAKEKADAIIEISKYDCIQELKQARKHKETTMTPTNLQNRFYFMIEEDFENIKGLQLIKYKKDSYEEVFYCKN